MKIHLINILLACDVAATFGNQVERCKLSLCSLGEIPNESLCVPKTLLRLNSRLAKPWSGKAFGEIPDSQNGRLWNMSARRRAALVPAR
jgi:hypothetical protein